MAKFEYSMTSALVKLREFFLNTLVVFGVVTVLKAAMVPHALSQAATVSYDRLKS